APIAEGRNGEGEAAAGELLEHLRSPLKLLPWWWPLDLVWSLRALGREQDFREASEREQAATLWLDAARAIAAGDVRGGADILGRMAAFADEAYARLRAAELLPPAEASVELERALGFFRSVGASAYAGEAEALLAATGS